MESNSGQRVAIYSHDTYGLGHLTRSARIARGVVEALPGASVLILSGSPIAHRFKFAPGVDYVKLPSVVKAGPDNYLARELTISPRRIRHMRMQLILDAVDLLRPHLFLVDNVPLGMKGELVPTLEKLRRNHPGTLIHLNLRDVLDDPKAICRSWEDACVYDVLRDFYDAIHVFGDRAVFDAVAAYRLPAEKTDFLGYIAPFPEERTNASTLPPGEARRFRILATTGGGGDGVEILRCVGQLQRNLGSSSPFQFHLITGPLMDPKMRKDMARSLDGIPSITLHEYVEHLPAWMKQCDVVLSMGGYNTLCEVMAMARRSIVVPRVYPRREQEIRAKALEGRGLLSVLHPRDLTPQNLEKVLHASLRTDLPLSSNGGPRLKGIANLQQLLKRLLQRSAPQEVLGAQEGPASNKEHPPGKQDQSDAIVHREVREVAEHRRGGFVPGGGPAAHCGPFLGVLIALLALGAGPHAQAQFKPQRVQASVALGWDTNLLDASDAERRAFEEQSPQALFAVNQMEDLFCNAFLEADWKLGRLQGCKTKLRARYGRTQFLENPIKSADLYALELHAKLRAETRIILQMSHRPQVYGRHRLDKDALPGQPQFRPEVHRRWDVGVELKQTLGRQWTMETGLGWSSKDYNHAFDERDRNRIGIAAGVSWRSERRLELGLAGGLRRSRSRNEPDLQKDLSYREWCLMPWIRVGEPASLAELEVSLDVKWRHYTSQKAQDWNHWGRSDRSSAFEVRIERALSRSIAFIVACASRWRTARLDSGLAVDYDEEGSFSEGVFISGFAWRWEA